MLCCSRQRRQRRPTPAGKGASAGKEGLRASRKAKQPHLIATLARGTVILAESHPPAPHARACAPVSPALWWSCRSSVPATSCLASTTPLYLLLQTSLIKSDIIYIILLNTSHESVHHCVSSVVLNIAIGALFAVKMPCSSLVNMAERGRSRQCSNSNETNLPACCIETRLMAHCARALHAPSHLISHLSRDHVTLPNPSPPPLPLPHPHPFHLLRRPSVPYLSLSILLLVTVSSLSTCCSDHVGAQCRVYFGCNMSRKLPTEECTRTRHARLIHLRLQATKATQFCQYIDICFHLVRIRRQSFVLVELDSQSINFSFELFQLYNFADD